MSDLFVVEVDTTASGTSSAFDGYKESTCNADYFQKNVVDNPKIICYKCQVAELCGLDVKLYSRKYRPGLASSYEQEGGAQGFQMAIMQNPDLFARNNGAAT